jgi:hypothetical protein
VPPEGENGVSGVLNWQCVGMLSQVAQLEKWSREPELSQRAERIAVS